MYWRNGPIRSSRVSRNGYTYIGSRNWSSSWAAIAAATVLRP
jgi:hypothetical protein